MDGLVNADPEVVALLDHSVGAGASSDVVPVGYKKDGSFSSYSKVATREEFSVIRKYTELKIREIGRGILDGNAEAAPYQLGAKTPARSVLTAESAGLTSGCRDSSTES